MRLLAAFLTTVSLSIPAATTHSDHDAEKGTVNLQPRGSEVGLTSESTVDDYEEDGQAEESQGLTGESAADEEVEEEVAYNDDGQAAV